jgi:hypothetical protein
VKPAEIITALINLAALIFVGAQVQLARRTLRESTRKQEQEWLRLRRQATIEMSASTEQYREELKAQLPWNDRDPKEVAAFLEERKGDHGRLTPVRAYLNHLEDLAVGVKAGVYDVEVISMLSGARIIATAASYAGYIQNIRLELDRPRTYECLDELVAQLKTLENEPAA